MKTRNQLLAVADIFLLCIVAHAECPGGFCRPTNRWAETAPRRLALDSSPLTLDSSAHCRIFVGDGTIGSGALISSNDTCGLVVTCSHLFDETESNIIVAFSDGSRYSGRLIGRERADDLGAVLIRR